MSTRKKTKLAALQSRMVFRLWSIMMVLVLFGVGFMWMAQIYLFEQNYAEAALNDTMSRMQPVMENLSSEDLAEDEQLLSHLSRITNGDMFLLNQQGKLLRMYSSGHQVNVMEKHEEQRIWEKVQGQEEFQNLLDGVPYTIVERHRNRIFGYELGFPVTYDGEPCFIILRNMLMLKTTLDLNRRQLIILSILLTAIASVLAAVLSRQFTRPIYQLRDTIERLTHHDFSARPQVERDDELGQLSRSVDELGQALQQVDVLRKEVIANVSHELRSPLAVISGYAEMVRDITWRDEAQRNEGLNLIISESRRMSEMVNDILDYSQLQAGYTQLKLDWYNLCDILDSEVNACRRGAAEHQITLTLHCHQEEVPVHVDALKLSQVIRNLLYNAINHTPEQGEILIVTEACKKAAPEKDGNVSHHVRVSVKNPGPPIPEAERELIWERYQRSQHHNGRRLGTGIGLSIVSTILQAHGMEYGVDCDEGWTVFWFEFSEETPD